ncbi:phosphoribosylamine--glycine ligase [Wenzhouxiangella marina]|uniref:Phosphoribosylamine--glycine ligase n=1 Tax=Wenzhouxiangella marina TaxID=1579979 RepID=A0A0K0XS60_9GAMM|nr:phosphoribosylamine--glycine ligase [Wenzhouxiangella marina]AKS40549.1 phosphoribosylamine--glycine ligase [Wenzhouxiangella marina]MBB6088317.1 phosphoribosylamine--glycine ligase [Wenzhouxiangella marina]
MKVLVIGGGGREHALAWKAAQSSQVDEVLVAPGNAGTASEPGCRNVDIGAEDIDALLELARTELVGLTIVGPEAPLAAGVVDRFQAAGLACFGPSAKAAQLESSKAFAKDFMARHRIPTARYGVVESVDEGMDMVNSIGLPLVLKADGLAAGKGVVIVDRLDQARATLEDMLSGQAFGEAGHRVVVEEFLIGEEASFIVIADGEHALPLATSQDHKRRDEGDQGPNTGGMGAYSPAPVVDAAMHQRILQEVIQPTLSGMQADGCRFTGFLYAGVMLTDDGPKVLEFNVRFGDPETQPILMRLQSDLVETLQRTLDGHIQDIELGWDERVALGIVLAAGGYPDGYEKGKPISGLDSDFPHHVKVFHAGTRLDEQGQVVTSGGRVLCVTALGPNVKAARDQALEWMARIGFEGAFYRSDIGHRAISRD